MKKQVKDFFKYIDKDTTIGVDFKTKFPTEKYKVLLHDLVLDKDTILISKGKMKVEILSYGKKEGNLIGHISIKYRYGKKREGTKAREAIKAVIPDIPIAIGTGYDEKEM